ncbi:MAG TPA: acetyl-CoA carboxylase biotin carboxyl carrier protein [Anaerohalosphaeraceae bacterium]|nr:acetyl-CoA carboxylase biotin carboxyl carrier protein [Anaerohalosphaeraceae bacterium]
MAEKQEKDLLKVKELVELMKENDLVEIEIVEGDSRIHLKRPGADARLIQYQPMGGPMPMPSYPPHVPMVQPAAPATTAAPAAVDSSIQPIKSPIVGTFYMAPSPDAAPFVKVGDQVNPETVVCIIEAMKVMNEIKAELSGTVVEICCKDGQAVEYGQALFKVRP